MENILCNELVARGFNVDVGVVEYSHTVDVGVVEYSHTVDDRKIRSQLERWTLWSIGPRSASTSSRP